MKYHLTAFICTAILALSFSACSLWDSEPEALSGVAPSTVDAAPEALSSSESFYYDGGMSLSESFNQMNALRLTICNSMYSAVVRFSDDSAWVPIAANNYALGSDEFLAASFVAEEEPNITAKKLFEDSGFEDIQISQLDIQNTWSIRAIKKEDNAVNTYDYTVRYGQESDSCRFTLEINKVPSLMLASRRITGGYAVQVWTPEGTYNMLAHDTKEGRFGFVPNADGDIHAFPENDIYFDDGLVTSTFTTAGADYTFLLANNILYIAKDGSNYAVPLP